MYDKATVRVGSTVRGNLPEEELIETESKGELDTLTINGQTYTLREYAAGKGINIEGSDGKYTVSVNAADDNIVVSSDGVGLNQKEVRIGDIIVAGNRDDDGNPDNNTIQGLSNTTWDETTMKSVSADGIEASKAATQGQLLGAVNMAANADRYLHNGTERIKTDDPSKVIFGYKVNDDGTVTMTVANKEGENAESVVIGNIASKTALDSLDDFAVKYDADTNGIDYTSVTLGSHDNKYNTEDRTGGTTITNVAYADINSASSGSHAVNVDLLKDYVSSMKTELQGSDQHLLQNSASEDGSYSVSENHDVTLNVGTGKEGETPTNVVIKDVASHTEVGNINDINKDLWNKDETTGDVSENPPTVVDAINNVNTKVDAVDEKVGDTQYKHTDGSATTIVTAGDDVTTSIGKLDGAIGDLQGKVEEAGKHSTVSVGNGLELVTKPATDAAGTDYNVSLKDNFTLGGKDNQTGKIDFKGSEDTLSASGNINAGSFSTTGGITIGKNTEEKNVIGGLQNITWNPDSIVSGQAATEDQLKEAVSGAVQYDRNEDGSIDKTHVTFNKGGDSVTLQNVAKGDVNENPTQAVNGAQLFETNQAVEMNRTSINMLSNSVNKLDNRIDRVGAGAAALAALHPLDFDPDAKWDFAAGYGNYRGASAVAMGAYYRPNEDVMLSVGGSMGGGENMVNAGVSIKLGAGSSHVSTSRVAMAKEIESLRGTVAQLTALVNTMVGSQHRIQNELSTEFPDVPENHWAYEAVETLAKSGLAVGYPDGQFKGDRSLTRYEFAEIVHRALQAGVGVDARLVEEFKPELEFFRIDTITTDADGNPVIQRVRVNK